MEATGERVEAAKAATGERVEAAKVAAGERVEAAKVAAVELHQKVKPKLRGVIHEYSFPVSLVAGGLLVYFAAGRPRAPRPGDLRDLALGPARHQRPLPPGQLEAPLGADVDAPPRPLDDLPADRRDA